MAPAGAVLVATSQQLLLLAGDEVRVVHQGSGLYFGMAECQGLIYVACHHDTLAAPTAEDLDAQVGSLLVLDPHLRVVDELHSSVSPLRQPHAVAAIAGRVWVTGTYDDQVQVHDPATRDWEVWVPDRGSGPARPDHDDRFHYNAIREIYGGLQLLAHNYGRSQMLTYTHPGLELVSVQDLGVGAHDLFDHAGQPAVCSSLESALRGAGGWARRVGGFPRGIAEIHDETVIGFSEFAGRDDRHATDGRLVRFDGDWQPVAEIGLPGSGQILDLLPIPWSGELDQFAHRTPLQVRHAPELDPQDITAYRVPLAAPPLSYAEWHPGEIAQQFMAARRARVPVLINPGERTITVDAVSYRMGRSVCRVLLDGAVLGELIWDEPGGVTGTFRLPRATRDRRSATAAELALEVDQLWRPDGDPRMIGVGLHRISFS